jgi:tRNA (cytidine/uridine-2'-O-)-methyltransferase
VSERSGKPQAIPLKKTNYATDCRIIRQGTQHYTPYRDVLCAFFLQPKGKSALRLALYEPDIPQNTGALLRLAACFGVAVDLIEPFGFVFDDRRLKRAALDYAALAQVARHASWVSFMASRAADSRLVLMTTSGDVALDRFVFAPGDTILLGRESAGVPRPIHDAVDARVVIRLRAQARSLNVAQAGAIALYEALRQTGQLPLEPDRE